jgi:DNA-binding transcriptional LysR family regulator
MGMVLPEIRLLQAAIALAEELNFSRAAERLRIEQSTLSKRIVELESQIDLRLFVRNHQTVELTDAGRHFVEDARSAVLYAERAVADARAALHGADEVLHIGRSAYADPYLVTTIQSIQLSLFPGLKVKLWSNFSHELARMVAAGKLDLALVMAIPDTPALSFLSIAEAPAYIALPKNDAIARSAKLDLVDLRAHEWILPASHVNPHISEMIQAASSARGIVAPDTHSFTVAEEASALVLAQRGAAFLTRESAWRISSDEIAIRPLAEERLKLVTRLVMRSDDKRRLTSEFVRAVGRKLVKIQPPQQRSTALDC